MTVKELMEKLSKNADYEILIESEYSKHYLSDEDITIVDDAKKIYLE